MIETLLRTLFHPIYTDLLAPFLLLNFRPRGSMMQSLTFKKPNSSGRSRGATCVVVWICLGVGVLGFGSGGLASGQVNPTILNKFRFWGGLFGLFTKGLKGKTTFKMFWNWKNMKNAKNPRNDDLQLMIMKKQAKR